MNPQRLEQIRAGVAQDWAYWSRSIVGELLEEVERLLAESEFYQSSYRQSLEANLRLRSSYEAKMADLKAELQKERA